MAILIILSLVLSVFPVSVENKAAETVDSTEEEEVVFVEDPDWESKEVVKELDEDNKDSEGCQYRLYPIEKTAEIYGISTLLIKNADGDFILRVPDWVVKDGKEYVVSKYAVTNTAGIKGKVRVYIGKEVTDIQMASMYDSTAFYVHKENKSYTSEEGTLFSYDRTTLVSFNDDNYGSDATYVIPDSVSEIDSDAFYGAKIKEVILNDQIKELAWCVFCSSTLKKIDLKKVKTIGDYAFSDCRQLEEVKINEEGVTVSQYSFSGTRSLKNLYFPSGVKFTGTGSLGGTYSGLETVIVGDNMDLTECGSPLFEGTHWLRTLILPGDITEIQDSMVRNCPMLRKLYVPDSVEKIGTAGFNATGHLTLYGKEDSPAAEYDDDNVEFVSLSGHEHKLEEVTFFVYDSWGVKGKYCRECAYASEIEMVEFDTEEQKQEMPELLVQPEDECPDVLELNDDFEDEQGLIYEVDPVFKVATVKDIDPYLPFPRKFIAIPEKVEKDGKLYTVDTLGEYALGAGLFIILPDTIKEIGRGALQQSWFVVLGENVEKIDEQAFWQANPKIKIRGENPYYKIVDGVLFDSDMTQLIKCINYPGTEYTVPVTVQNIWDSAFYRNDTLEKITIYNKDKLTIDKDAFWFCNAEIVYLEDSDIIYPEATVPAVTDPYIWCEEEETVVELDSENKDESGYYYNLTGSTLTAELYALDMSVYDEDADEINLRIPDKVTKNGRTYTVERVLLNPKNRSSGNQLVHLYIGKYVSSVYLSTFEWKVASHVHAQNKNFISDRGSLYDIEKRYLYRFCDETYEKKDSFSLPRKVVMLYDLAFYKAEIGEVLFNSSIKTIPYKTFMDSSIKRVDLNGVNQIASYAFFECHFLKEVVIREESVIIRDHAFNRTYNLEGIYIPAKAELEGGSFMDSGLKTVIMGEEVSFSTASFAECYDLQTLILPDSMKSLPDVSFRDCISLAKLYIPEGVSEIGDECFKDAVVNLFGKKGSAVESIADEAVHFTSLEGHEHHLKKVTFFSFNTWAVTGSYCRECGYGTQCKKIEWEEGEKPEELPESLVQPEITCPEKLELNINDTDSYGIIYELDSETMTATVIGTNAANRACRYIITVPEKVEKGGQTYVVDTIGEDSLKSALSIVLPDTVTTLERYCFGSNLKKLIMGSGVKTIDDESLIFVKGPGEIRFRSENNYFMCENGILYNKDKTKLYKFCNYCEDIKSEFTVPDTVTQIMGDAFNGMGTATGLSQINIKVRHDLDINDRAFEGCDSYVNYIGSFVTPETSPPVITETPLGTPTPPPANTTEEPEETPTPKTPTPAPTNTTEEPEKTPTPKTPTPAPANTTEEPEETPTPKTPTPAPANTTEEPETTQTEEPSRQIPAADTPAPQLPPVAEAAQVTQLKENDLFITGFRVVSNYNKSVKICWKRNVNAVYYRIYRAQKRNGTYKLIQVVSGSKTNYIDKKAKSLKTYFYRMSAVGNGGGAAVEGERSSVRSICISGIGAPKVRVKKGKIDLVRYITVTLKHYDGKYADIYISLGGKKFSKLKLVSNRISKYKGNFKIRYMVKNKMIRLKVRTYKKKGKKKVYGAFSKVARIKV